MKNLIVIVLIFLTSIGIFFWALRNGSQILDDPEISVEEIDGNQKTQEEDLTQYFQNIEVENDQSVQIEEEDSCILFGEVTTNGTVSSNTVCLSSGD